MDKKTHQQAASVVIPCYNERKTIRSLIRELKQSPLIDEIIVVDDGSSDDTSEEAALPSVQVIRLEQNLGKSKAMAIGVGKTHNETILFLDGDMSGLPPKAIEMLLCPVLLNKVDMNIALRKRSSNLMDSIFMFLPLLSGARAISREKWETISAEGLEGFSIETAINYIAREEQWRIGIIIIPGLSHRIKEDKYGIALGLKSRTKMIMDISRFYWNLGFLKTLNSLLKEKKIYELQNLKDSD